MTTKRTLVILADSNVLRGSMTETVWAGFSTPAEAELVGNANIKSIKWRVAHRVERGEGAAYECFYEFASPLRTPENRLHNLLEN